MKRLYAIVFLLFCAMAAADAQTFAVANLVYSVNEDMASVTVTGHVYGSEATGSIAIPNTVQYNGKTYPVTVIGDNAFCKHLGLQGPLTIGNNVTDIGNAAFELCDGLSGDLIIPNSVIHIGHYAFRDCDGFTGDLTIPSSVTTIGYLAFEQCDGFDGTLTIGSSVGFIGDAAFQLCRNFSKAVCLATEPPVLESRPGAHPWLADYYEFNGFGCSEITVPCGSKTAYENSPWHSTHFGFGTIIEDCDDVEESEEATVSLYPNPTIGMVNVNGCELRTIEVVNITGQTVLKTCCEGGVTAIDIANQPVGVYFLNITDVKGRTFTGKVLKR